MAQISKIADSWLFRAKNESRVGITWLIIIYILLFSLLQKKQQKS